MGGPVLDDIASEVELLWYLPAEVAVELLVTLVVMLKWKLHGDLTTVQGTSANYAYQ